jgi:TRAP-type mannitol/chloroaromatic compound transport system substrate-binding protein
MKKTRRDFLKSAGVSAVAAGAVMGGVRVAHSAEETWKWKGQIFCSRGNRFFEQAEDLAFMIDKYTNGRVKSTLHQAGELVPAGQVFDAAGRGIMDYGVGCPCLLKSKAYGAQLFCDCPGAQSPIEKVIWYYNGGGKEILEDIMHQRYNAHPLYSQAVTAEIWLFTNKKINSIEDIKGMKMRAAGIRGEILQKMGMSVVVLPEPEIVPSVERKVIDAMEFSSVNCTFPIGFQDVTKYIYIHPLKAPSSMILWAVNLDKWNKLPADRKKAIEMASRDCVLRSISWGIEQDTLVIKKAVEEKKNEIFILPDKIVRVFDEAAADYYYEKAKTDKTAADILASWAKFKKDYGKYASYIDLFNKTGDRVGLLKGAS